MGAMRVNWFQWTLIAPMSSRRSVVGVIAYADLVYAVSIKLTHTHTHQGLVLINYNNHNTNTEIWINHSLKVALK